MIFEIPYPPSINHYMIQSGKRRFLSEKARDYREKVFLIVHNLGKSFNKLSKLSLNIEMFPPDNRIRDVDNILKATLDALQHAGLYSNDYQIEQLSIHRKEKKQNGCLIISIEEINKKL